MLAATPDESAIIILFLLLYSVVRGPIVLLTYVSVGAVRSGALATDRCHPYL